MFSFFYDFILFLIGLIALPRLLWLWAVKGKYRNSLAERLGFKLPNLAPSDQPTIWLHMASMGETRAVSPLYKRIKQELPNVRIIISNITETGHMEAKRGMPGAELYFYLPLDFSWAIRKLVRNLNPDMLILVEGEFWYHLIDFAKKNGASVVLVNGKVSERSAKRFKIFKTLTTPLFANFDKLCLQTELYEDRFSEMGIDKSKLFVTGNLKFDVESKKLSSQEIGEWKKDLNIDQEDKVLVIGSTHNSEEEMLLTALKEVWQSIPNLKVILVPRHPERFTSVAAFLKNKDIPFVAYSEKDKKSGNEKVVLIDTMGLLHTCYQLGELAIVAGSFIETVGGHNIFEPVECGVPVLFGPHMKNQLALVEIILNAKAGKQVTIDKLSEVILKLLQDPQEYQQMQKACLKLTQEMRGSTERTWEAISPFLKKKIV